MPSLVCKNLILQPKYLVLLPSKINKGKIYDEAAPIARTHYPSSGVHRTPIMVEPRKFLSKLLDSEAAKKLREGRGENQCESGIEHIAINRTGRGGIEVVAII